MKNVQPTRFVQEKDFFQTSSGFINILVSVIELYFSENPNAYVIHGECDPIKFTNSNIALCKFRLFKSSLTTVEEMRTVALRSQGCIFPRHNGRNILMTSDYPIK